MGLLDIPSKMLQWVARKLPTPFRKKKWVEKLIEGKKPNKEKRK